MNILIFGASGDTGHELVSQALIQDHFVTAFVRDPTKFQLKHVSLRIFKGDVTDYRNVEDAVTDQDAVLSALGASSPFKRDFTLIKGIQNIVAAMTKQNVSRFIYQSFLGVKEHRKELGLVFNTLIPVILANVIADHEAKEDIIVKSNLNWTIVRCSILTNDPFTNKYRHGEHIRFSSLIPSIARGCRSFYAPADDRQNLSAQKTTDHVLTINLNLMSASTSNKRSVTLKKPVRKWSARVMERSDALDLQSRIFKSDSADKIARSLKRSAERSKRKKGTSFQSAMSMLNFYINRAGKNLSSTRKNTLERAKNKLRQHFGRSVKK